MQVSGLIMSDETEIGFAGAHDRPGHSGGSAGEQSPLQARAAFLKNRSWELVISLNRGACARGGAQHGQNPESYAALEADWRQRQGQESTLDEAIEFLRLCHRRAPFLFFNGNTFAMATPLPTLVARWLTLCLLNCPPVAAVKSCPPSPTTSPAYWITNLWNAS